MGRMQLRLRRGHVPLAAPRSRSAVAVRKEFRARLAGVPIKRVLLQDAQDRRRASRRSRGTPSSGPLGHFRFCRCQYHHMHHASRAQTSQGARNITILVLSKRCLTPEDSRSRSQGHEPSRGAGTGPRRASARETSGCGHNAKLRHERTTPYSPGVTAQLP